jgi:hypothetical protein
LITPTAVDVEPLPPWEDEIDCGSVAVVGEAVDGRDA